jgi:hypothetical protein
MLVTSSRGGRRSGTDWPEIRASPRSEPAYPTCSPAGERAGAGALATAADWLSETAGPGSRTWNVEPSPSMPALSTQTVPPIASANVRHR